MACGYYMNMERIAIEIAMEHIELMEENIQDENVVEFLDLDKVVKNIKNGFVVISQSITFIESFLNTIINNCMMQNTDLLLKMSIEEKLEVVCLYYKKKTLEIKETHYWEMFRKMNKIRNELVHFKRSYICECSAIQDFNIANISVKAFFIKSNMKKALEQIIDLGDCIANVLDLKVCSDIGIIECDARDGLVSYVYDAKMIDIDTDRNIN